MSQQVMGSSLSGNMLISQASVLGSGQRFFCLAVASMAFALSPHSVMRRTPLECNECLVLVHAGSQN